ncbi:Motile sperm domain-containing protein 2-like protein [Leptotrombidium deliense]|uniref:Motile sperm domain-containing protein 2-like protein n=1 Tax=Leptotrombidium deliense TaxID=299467 RepID=A0A443S4X8_9ACAR|nr:Motile sperm domain-containing protein 2-like protein [Leptotrombidium deliense]
MPKKFIPPPPPLSPKDPELQLMIKTVRTRFLDEYENNKELYIESDVDKIRKTDFPVRRCIFGCKLNVDDAYEMLKNAMRWRKETGFEEASPTRFPLEFYKIGAVFCYECDNEGTPLLYLRFKVHKKMEILQDPVKKFLIYNMEILDRKIEKERGWGIVFDAQGSSVSNIDFNLLIFLIKTVKNYYTWALKYILVYELPWYLSGAWKLALALVPEEARNLFRLCYKNDIKDVINAENLPDFMGGTCKRNYREIPEGAKPAEEIGKLELGLTSDEVHKIKIHFEKYLCEEE